MKDNSQNATTNNNMLIRGRKLDLGTIADIVADETNGVISKDLYDALKMAEAAGLCTEDKPLSEFILWKDRKLDYDAEELSMEADLVLLIRAKAGDNNAKMKLFENKKQYLRKLAYLYTQKYKNSGSVLENDFDYYEQEVFLAFFAHIAQHPVCSQGKILFSHAKIKYTLLDNIDKKIKTFSIHTNFAKDAYTASRIKKQILASNTDIQVVDYKQMEEYCKAQGYKDSTIKRLYEAQYYVSNNEFDYSVNRNCFDLENNSSYSENNTTDDFVDYLEKRDRKTFSVEYLSSSANNSASFDVDGRTCYDYDPANIDFDNSEFINFIIELRQDKKHGRDIETLLAHVMGEKNFDFSNMFAENADNRASLQETADLMGYETAYEVKLAMKRAKEFIISSMKKKYPEMLAELSKDRKRAM